jgi:hypothetical protein
MGNDRLIQVQQHDNKEEQNHDGTRVNDDMHDGKKLSI